MNAGAVIKPPSTCWLVVEHLPGGTLADGLYGEAAGGGVLQRTMVEKVEMGLRIAWGMLVRVCLAYDRDFYRCVGQDM